MGKRGPKQTPLDILEKRGSWRAKARRKQMAEEQRIVSPKPASRPSKIISKAKMLSGIPDYDPTGGGKAYKTYKFDYAKAKKAVEFFHNELCHVKGEKTGEPFILEPWEQAIVGNLFGWLHKKTGLRRYRECFIEIARKNGKTPIAAGLLLYLLFEDGEPGAEIYGAASEYKQASLVFTHAWGMINRNPRLKEKCQIFKGQSKAIEVGEPGDDGYGVYRVISSDSFAAHGFNTHATVVDELHTQPNRDLTDALMTSTGARRQPLIIYITTSDYEREGSICNEKEDYALNICKGVIDDPSFLPVVYKADINQHTESFVGVQAIDKLQEICDCKNVNDTQIEMFFREACASLAIQAGIRKTGRTTESGVKSTQTDQLGQGECAQPATNNFCLTEIQNTNLGQSENGLIGQRETQKEEPRVASGGHRKTKKKYTFTDYRLCTGSPQRTSCGCENHKTIGALFAERKQNWSSTTAILLGLLEDCCVPSAIVESAFSEILSKIYGAHSNTCLVRKKCTCKKNLVEIQCDGDDWTSPATWKKANPNLGVSVSLEYLERECKRAQEIPTYENTFKRLHLNIRTEQDVRWIPLADWDKCEGIVLPEALVGHRCFAGLDLSTTRDITALVLYFPEAGQVLPVFWVPRDGARDREKTDRVPYVTWANQGYIRLTEGNTVDYEQVMSDIADLFELYGIERLGFDRFMFEALRQQLLGIGVAEEKMVAFGQGFVSMSAPSKELERLILAGKLQHGGNPVLRWMAQNVSVSLDAAGNIKPDKKKSSERIDGIVALIMAIGMGMVAEPESESVYETRGILEVDW